MTRGRKPGTTKCSTCHKFHSGRCRCDSCGELGHIHGFPGLFTFDALCHLCAKDYAPDGFSGLPHDCPGCLTLGSIQAKPYGRSKTDWQLDCQRCQTTYYLSEGSVKCIES